MDLALLLKQVVGTILFSLIGLLIFALFFWAVVRTCPFSIRKEIEHDQNVALAVIIGAGIIGIAIIIAAAVHG